MKIAHLFFGCYIAALGVVNVNAQNSPVSQRSVSQRSTAQPRGVQIAVIDVRSIFETHPGFKQKMEAIKGEVEGFEKEMVEQRKRIAGQQNQLNEYKIGSPEYKRREAEITQQVSDLQVKAQLKRKDVLQREAKIYYEAYNEVLQEVEAIANRYGIGLVIRYDSSDIDPQDRASVLKGVNRPVVYQKQLDITAMVKKTLDQRYTRVGSR